MRGDYQDFSEKTRQIYHQQHMRLVDDDTAIKRHLAMFSQKYFGLGEGWFIGKSILDAGCGDTAKALIRFYQFGARDLHGIDLEKEFIPIARRSLEAQGIPANAVTFRSGSVLQVPYETNRFDFTCCHGVLLHLNNMDEVVTAFGELARVTKPDGYLYTVFGLVGGLFEEAILPAVRKYYRENEVFRILIDNLSPKDFERVISKIMEAHNITEDLTAVCHLFDVDLCVFIQNVLQAPVRLKIPEDFIRKQFSENGFGEPRILKRFVKRNNIRKFFAPLHFDHEYPISRILYGSGNLEFIARKV